MIWSIGIILSVARIAAAQGTCNTVPGQCTQEYPCCSQYGWCGNTLDHCGAGCNVFGSFQGKGCFDSKCQVKHYDLGTSKIVPSWNNPGDADFVVDGGFEVRGDAVVLKMSKPESGASMYSSRYLSYGRVSADVKTSRTGGVVSSFVLQAKDKDEIDFEWVGKSLTEIQTTWFKRGEFAPWPETNGKFYPGQENTYEKFHTYTIDWSPRRIQWFVDGRLLRQLDTNDPTRFPASPSRVGLGIWDGGSGAEGTREWAGGYINFNSEDMRNQGYFDVQVKNVIFACSTDQ